ncbi:MAG: hypothetical protein LBV04_01765, partial [Deferribacteraceae bacterium]|nr:hypothetical protein [Deferribacteraceae bacterium]
MMKQLNAIIENFQRGSTEALNNLHTINYNSIRHYCSYLELILGDRLLAYALACDDITQMKEHMDSRQASCVQSLVKFFRELESLPHYCKEIILIKCVSFTHDLLANVKFCDTETQTEHL